MKIHVYYNHHVADLGRSGFLDQIHTFAEFVAVIALILSGIGMYLNRKGQKATVEDLALLLSIFAVSISGLQL